MQRIFYLGLEWLETRLFGTRIQEWRWKLKTFGGDASLPNARHAPHPAERGLGDVQRFHPHRAMLLTALEAYMPSESVLEIGCGRGDNLYLLGVQHPTIVLHGIDINTKAVNATRQRLVQSGFKLGRLSEGRADDLSQCLDKSIDIVFSDAVLLYVGPDKIKKVLNEMARIAKKAVILSEWHSDLLPEFNPSRYFDAHWIHNYRALFEGIPSVVKIQIEPIPEEIWGGSGWKEYGSLIEARLNSQSARQARLA